MSQVAWIHFERSAILTVQNHVITRNPRIGVSHEGHRTWNLHIRNVQRADQGAYMCQINTAKAKTRLGYLNVVGRAEKMDIFCRLFEPVSYLILIVII